LINKVTPASLKIVTRSITSDCTVGHGIDCLAREPWIISFDLLRFMIILLAMAHVLRLQHIASCYRRRPHSPGALTKWYHRQTSEQNNPTAGYQLAANISVVSTKNLETYLQPNEPSLKNHN